ncbi:MAG: YidC/Oxa1 family membrane protein insertase [Firmicutes bacterium]|nr:YidC/Oxa1 family membrane protein insertase [Candidatus Caballimonas caccae]
MKFTLINFAEPSISGIAVIVKWLIGISSSIAVGVILFTLVLKLITFPFDFFSRYSMRKNSVKMEEMRPDLEKLQKQYANDKTLYNQKMMALYKKNGYSMWGSCLPTIITLVIFIIAINGYSSYSRFQNKQYFYNMSLSYNTAIYDGVIEDIGENKYITKDEKTGAVIIDPAILTNGTVTGTTKINNEEKPFDIVTTIDGNIATITTEYGYTTVKVQFNETDKKITNIEYHLNDYSKVNAFYNLTGDKELKTPDEAVEFIKDLGSERSAETYRSEEVRFLWVKNIWVTDSPIAHPVCETWETEGGGCSSCFGAGAGFKNTHSYSDKGEMNKDLYAELIQDLTDETTEANGYFILCILTAGITFLMQLVMSKSQKAQMELQTVDGQGARQQKMMMWMMPILMAFFSFMYTAAFSIYLILSSVISILTTFLINWVVDKKLGKVKKEPVKQIIRGRVHDEPLQETKKSKKDNKKDNKNSKPKGDFIPQDQEDNNGNKLF